MRLKTKVFVHTRQELNTESVCVGAPKRNDGPKNSNEYYNPINQVFFSDFVLPRSKRPGFGVKLFAMKIHLL